MADEPGSAAPPQDDAVEADVAAYSERLLAFTIDLLLVAVPVGALAAAANLGDFPAGLAVLAAFLGYQAAFAGATPGKRVAGIRAVTLQGEAPSLVCGLIRAAGSLLSLMTFGLGFAAVFFTDHRRALEDFLAGTCVVTVRQKGRLESWAIFLAGWLLPVLFAANAAYRYSVPRALAQAETVDSAKATLLILGTLEEKRKAATGRYSDDIKDLAEAAQSPQDLLNALPQVLAPASLKIRVSAGGYEISARAKDPRGTPVSYVWPAPSGARAAP